MRHQLNNQVSHWIYFGRSVSSFVIFYPVGVLYLKLVSQPTRSAFSICRFLFEAALFFYKEIFMKKKLLLLSALCVRTIAFGAPACNNTTEHTHEWSDTYTADGGRHYQTCSGCNEKQYGSHNYIDLVCDECGRNLPVVDGTEGLRYQLNYGQKSYSVTASGTAYAGDVVIPSVYKGLPVTTIGRGAFEDCTLLTSITIPDSITSISSEAFYRCTSLTSITIPNSVTSIGATAFARCTSLTDISIPNSVTSIYQDAFHSCSSLERIIIHNSVTTIGNNAFYGCTSLTIYCEAEEKPSDWNENWNHSNCPVVWGYKG